MVLDHQTLEQEADHIIAMLTKYINQSVILGLSTVKQESYEF